MMIIHQLWQATHQLCQALFSMKLQSASNSYLHFTSAALLATCVVFIFVAGKNRRYPITCWLCDLKNTYGHVLFRIICKRWYYLTLSIHVCRIKEPVRFPYCFHDANSSPSTSLWYIKRQTSKKHQGVSSLVQPSFPLKKSLDSLWITQKSQGHWSHSASFFGRVSADS